MGHVLWYTKNQLVAERRLPKVQTRLINDYLHFHNIYDPGQLLLIPVSQYEFADPLVPVCVQYMSCHQNFDPPGQNF